MDADDAYKRVFWSYYTSSVETALIYFIVVIAFLKVPSLYTLSHKAMQNTVIGTLFAIVQLALGIFILITICECVIDITYGA